MYSKANMESSSTCFSDGYLTDEVVASTIML